MKGIPRLVHACIIVLPFSSTCIIITSANTLLNSSRGFFIVIPSGILLFGFTNLIIFIVLRCGYLPTLQSSIPQ
jgi:hypothetical protein